MKVRESGMPEETAWGIFFGPDKILKTLGVDEGIENIAEFGCGYGTFTIPAARAIRGKIYAIDIEQDMIEITERKARKNKLDNIETMLRDFILEGSGLEDKSVDYVMLFNILHGRNPEKLLREAYRILKTDRKIGIIHWNYDKETPRGPPMNIRPRPEQCIKWAASSGFNSPETYDLKPFHYGIVMRKKQRNQREQYSGFA